MGAVLEPMLDRGALPAIAAAPACTCVTSAYPPGYPTRAPGALLMEDLALVETSSAKDASCAALVCALLRAGAAAPVGREYRAALRASAMCCK